MNHLTTQYQELQQKFSSGGFSQSAIPSSRIITIPAFENKNHFPDYSKITKEIEEIISMSYDQLKNEVEQRFEIFSSKNTLVYKTLENKIENVSSDTNKIKQDLNKHLERNCDAIKDLEKHLEATENINLDRYKELTMKFNASSLSSLTDEIVSIKHKIDRCEDFKKCFETNEIRRELEVKEASQSAWNVESKIKDVEQVLAKFINSNRGDSESHLKSLVTSFESRLDYTEATLKKYLNVQKSLHKKVETLSDIFENSRREQTVKIRNRSSSSKSNKSITPKGQKNEEPLYSPTLNSSRVSILKTTPRGKASKAQSTQKSRIDILYDELSNMFT